MKKNTKRSYPSILDLAERLYDAEARLAADPSDDVLRRIVENRRGDLGRYRYEGRSGQANLLITVADWERVENGEAIPLHTYGGGYHLVSTADYEKGRRNGSILIDSERRQKRARIRREVKEALASGPAAVLDLVNAAFERFENAS